MVLPEKASVSVALARVPTAVMSAIRVRKPACDLSNKGTHDCKLMDSRLQRSKRRRESRLGEGGTKTNKTRGVPRTGIDHDKPGRDRGQHHRPVSQRVNEHSVGQKRVQLVEINWVRRHRDRRLQGGERETNLHAPSKRRENQQTHQQQQTSTWDAVQRIRSSNGSDARGRLPHRCNTNVATRSSIYEPTPVVAATQH